MKPFRWSQHALDAIGDRFIDLDEADRALHEPDATDQVMGNRRVYMRRFPDPRLGREMLLRVIVEDGIAERVVGTVYKTSRIHKYLGGRRT